MSCACFRVIPSLTTVLSLVFFAGVSNAASSCPTDLRNGEGNITLKIESSLDCLSRKIDQLEKNSETHLEFLKSQIDQASDLGANAKIVASEADQVANRARSTAGRAQANAHDLEERLKDADEIIQLLQGITNLEKFLTNNSDFQRKIADLVISVPRGTIAAFDLNKCPIGWSEFDVAAGRAIVGAGSGTNLTAKEFRETGGEESVTLSIFEMPKHEHKFKQLRGDVPDKNTYPRITVGSRSGEEYTTMVSIGGDNPNPQDVADLAIAPVGGSQPHNNMPPYIALYYCKKE